jgi:glycosyltransferase involved in cell wall biosynthesis
MMRCSGPKKVLYLCEGSGFAGAESYTLNLIRKMASLGVTCLVATCYEGPLKDWLEKESCKAVSLHGRNNWKSVREIIKIVATEEVEVLHCVDLKSAIVGGVASVFMKGVKTVATVHGLPEPYRDLRRNLKYMFSLTIYFLFLRMLFDGIICVSKDLRDRMERIIGPGKIRVIHNGIDVEASERVNQKPTDANRKIKIGTVGRLDSVKGHIYFLEAAKDIIKDRDDVIFQIVGSGPLEKDLKEKAKSLGVADKVHFLGFRPDARSLIADMDIFVLPSLHEGIPYVLLEAMACSKPVICSDVGGVKEVVKNNDDGILLRPGDPDAISVAIRQSLLELNHTDSMGQKARQKIEAEFSSVTMANNTLCFYKEIW